MVYSKLEKFLEQYPKKTKGKHTHTIYGGDVSKTGAYTIPFDKTDEFHKLTNGESNFITAFRRSDEFDNLILNQPQNLLETSHNGQVVYQYPFFKEFTEEEDSN